MTQRLSECDDPDEYQVFVVKCEDCDLEETYDGRDPPGHVVDYWGSVEAATEQWAALSAAKGKKDNHNMSAFVDYESGERHTAFIEAIK